jgi:hypothetical protein
MQITRGLACGKQALNTRVSYPDKSKGLLVVYLTGFLQVSRFKFRA